MLEFIKSNLYSILTVVAFLGLCAILIKKGYEDKVKQMLFYLVCKAEELYGSGTGDLKYSAVVTWVYDQLPSIVKLLFTTKQIDKYIEVAVVQMKEYLSKNNQAKARITSDNTQTISIGAGTTIMSAEAFKNLPRSKHLEGGR